MTKTFKNWETCEVCEGTGTQLKDVNPQKFPNVGSREMTCVCQGTGLQRKEVDSKALFNKEN